MFFGFLKDKKNVEIFKTIRYFRESVFNNTTLKES